MVINSKNIETVNLSDFSCHDSLITAFSYDISSNKVLASFSKSAFSNVNSLQFEHVILLSAGRINTYDELNEVYGWQIIEGFDIDRIITPYYKEFLNLNDYKALESDEYVISEIVMVSGMRIIIVCKQIIINGPIPGSTAAS
jgi:hypothetical protein